MGSWKAGPEKPRTPFCWSCSRRFHGRAHARIKMHSDDVEHDVHRNCAARLMAGTFTLVYESTTEAPRG